MQEISGLVKMAIHGLHLSDDEIGVCVGEEIVLGLVDADVHCIINGRRVDYSRVYRMLRSEEEFKPPIFVI